MIPYHIADQSISFFAKGRSYILAGDHQHFAEIKHLLQQPDADPVQLALLADAREAVAGAMDGKVRLVGNRVLFKGEELHNCWVDKIIRFQKEGLDPKPLLHALEDLQLNPYEKARRRLPVFVEQSKLGLLPDGRITALKAVDMDFKDCWTHTIDNSIGSKVVWPLDQRLATADNDSECTSDGYHVGIWDYVRGYGGSDKRVLLVAFWPRHVVGVSEREGARKMRTYEYDVLEELDQGQILQFISENELLVRRSNEPAFPPAPEAECIITDLELPERAEILQTIREKMEDIMGRSYPTVHEDLILADFLDHIEARELRLALSERYDINMGFGESREIDTAGNLVDLILKKLTEKGEPEEQPVDETALEIEQDDADGDLWIKIYTLLGDPGAIQFHDNATLKSMGFDTRVKLDKLEKQFARQFKLQRMRLVSTDTPDAIFNELKAVE